MIKLIAIESKGEAKLLLRFSDGSAGTYDFAPFIDANTEMTAPLADANFFSQHFIEAGALAWPNGFDLSAASLYRHLAQSGNLSREPGSTVKSSVEAWMDLIETLEALCPRWPERELSNGTGYRL